MCNLFDINLIYFETVCRRSEMTRQQWVSCSDQQLLNMLLVHLSGVNVHRLHSCWRRTFWAHAVIQMMWC